MYLPSLFSELCPQSVDYFCNTWWYISVQLWWIDVSRLLQTWKLYVFPVGVLEFSDKKVILLQIVQNKHPTAYLQMWDRACFYEFSVLPTSPTFIYPWFCIMLHIGWYNHGAWLNLLSSIVHLNPIIKHFIFLRVVEHTTYFELIQCTPNPTHTGKLWCHLLVFWKQYHWYDGL